MSDFEDVASSDGSRRYGAVRGSGDSDDGGHGGRRPRRRHRRAPRRAPAPAPAPAPVEASDNRDADSETDRRLREQAARALMVSGEAEARYMRDKRNMRYPPTVYDGAVTLPQEDPDEYCFLCEQDLAGDIGSLQHSLESNIHGAIARTGEVTFAKLVDVIHYAYNSHVRPHLTKINGYNGPREKPAWSKETIVRHIRFHDVSDTEHNIKQRIQMFMKWLCIFSDFAMKRIRDEESGEITTIPNYQAFSGAIRASDHLTKLLDKRDKANRNSG